MNALHAFLARVSMFALCALAACSGGDDAAVIDAATPPEEGGVIVPADASNDTDARLDELDSSVVEPDAGADASAPEPDAGMAEPDAGPPPLNCPVECPVGDMRCHGGRVQRCQLRDNGCSSWRTELPCEDAIMMCIQTDTSASCEPRPPTCTDARQNQDETDVDCGGALCPGCVIDQRCELPGDCALGSCSDGVCTPVVSACQDLFALPTGFAQPSSLQWPLIAKDTGLRRPAIGSSFGELQEYEGTATYLHTGIDLRGVAGDRVKVVADGNIWLTANLSDCNDSAGDECRLYIKDTAGRYIYYYSHLSFFGADPMSLELRTAIMNASPQGGGYEIRPGTGVIAGQTLSAITNFGDGFWPHLHFGIFDATQNYDGIHPLLALDPAGVEPAIIDDEPPAVGMPLIVRDGATRNAPPFKCREANGLVDVLSVMSDSFYTTHPAPPSIGFITINGLYGARLLIRNAASGAVEEREWYEMSSVPFDCAGPLRGTRCPTQLSEADFLARSVDAPRGAPHMGVGVAGNLFELDSSSSGLGSETFVHVLTHSWGQPGAWDTRAVPNGMYEVSVEARDYAGNRAAAAQLVAVDNDGTFDPTLHGDAYVRDHATDSGALPSSLGNAPSWASPDIFIVPSGTIVALDDEPEPVGLVSGVSYDVYVRAHNASCGTVSNIRVRLSAATSDLMMPAERVAITPADAFVGDAAHPDGLTLALNESGLLGPFTFVPTEQLLGMTVGCSLIAEIDSAADPRATTDRTALDNNMAVRNVLLAGTTSTPALFGFGNDSGGDACVQLVFESTGRGMRSDGVWASIVVPSSPALAESWGAVPGTTIEPDGDTLVITFLRKRVALPPITVPASTRYGAAASLALISDGGVRFSQYVNGELSGTIELQ